MPDTIDPLVTAKFMAWLPSREGEADVDAAALQDELVHIFHELIVSLERVEGVFGINAVGGLEVSGQATWVDSG